MKPCALLKLIAAVLFLSTTAYSQCPEGIIPVKDSSGRGTGTLTVMAGGLVNLEFTYNGCESPVTINVNGTASETIQISQNGVSLIGPCEGPYTLSMEDPCNIGEGVVDLSLIVDTSTTGDDDDDGTGGDDDDDGSGGGDDDDDGTIGDDDDDGSGGGSGNAPEQIDFRSEIGATRPAAQLVDIDVEINPTVVRLADLSAVQDEARDDVSHVTVTARLVFSDGTISDKFSHCINNWQMWPISDDREADLSMGSWLESLDENANLRLYDPEGRLELSCGDEGSKLGPEEPVQAQFKVAVPRTGKVQSMRVPIQVVYVEDPEDPNSDRFTKVANLQIERIGTSGSSAGSSGPSARIVTYSRVLE